MKVWIVYRTWVFTHENLKDLNKGAKEEVERVFDSYEKAKEFIDSKKLYHESREQSKLKVDYRGLNDGYYERVFADDFRGEYLRVQKSGEVVW